MTREPRLGARSVALSLALAGSAPLLAQSGDAPARALDPGEPILALAARQDAAPAPAGPWRLRDALGLPDWFDIKGTFRARYETFDEQFRTSALGEQHALVHRALVEMTVKDRFLSATAELQDSRVYSGLTDARLDTTTVNTVELLQGYVAGEFTDALSPGDELRIQLGRHTMDVGSRRLVARNRYRNTINAFTGANAQWKAENGVTGRAFFTFPVQRLPRAAAELDDGDILFDEERTSVRFWGGHAIFPDAAAGMDAEFGLYGLDESDATGLNTRDRDLVTLNTRWWRPREAGALHWEYEGAYQFGESRSSTSSSTTLDHEAWFHHVTVGYSFEGDSKARLEALFDYASGDKDPGDDENNRFDTLFGARRFEFGPTGIFGAFARANLVSPGLRYTTKPATDWEFMLTHRFHYLASAKDAWTTSGLVDPTGDAGKNLGTLTEFRVRYDVVPKSLLLDFGMAYLSAGSFIEDAPNATSQGDTLYGYVQTNFSF